MSLKDKLEIGLKPDAPFRPDNLPDFQQDDPACKTGASPGNAPEVRRARKMCDDTVGRRRRRGAPRPARRRST
jgi:hypothetical protein